MVISSTDVPPWLGNESTSLGFAGAVGAVRERPTFSLALYKVKTNNSDSHKSVRNAVAQGALVGVAIRVRISANAAEDVRHSGSARRLRHLRGRLSHLRKGQE